MNAAKKPGVAWFLLTGFTFMLLGAAAIAVPHLAGQYVVFIVGGLLTLGGILQVLHGIRAEGFTRKLNPLVMGLIMAIGGVAILLQPWIGLSVLTFVLAVYFVVEGVWKIVSAFGYRPAAGWLAMLASGVIALVLGGLIFYGWPSTELWAVGLLIGIDLLTSGAALLALAITLRRLQKAAAAPSPG